jgi:hypothetical protein
VFLDSETSVLPARRSRSEPAPRATGRTGRRSGSGGSRTLTTSIKSRVRLPVTLRTRDRAREMTARACGGIRAVRADAQVGREGLAPSSLGVKARCSR